ncbi:MAG: hypothetical protein ACXAD7_14575 [Candidatus Kariarchaeaceae archaeon]|jgi:hypothetical protein
MTIVEEIEVLWNSNAGKDISEVVQQCLKLIAKASNENLEIPIELENDIVLAANYSSEYGSQKHEANHILNLYYRNLSEEEKTEKVFRLAATAASALLIAMSRDEQTNERSANEIMSDFGIDKTSTRSRILHTLVKQLIGTIKNARPNYWSLGVISFIGIYICILIELNKWSENDEQMVTVVKSMFSGPISENEQEEINRWKKTWSEKNDYFRFITLMIFNKHPQDDRWENFMKDLMLK